MRQRLPIGIRLVRILFVFGACMGTLTTAMLLFPGTALDSLWRLNPGARSGFQKIGVLLAAPLMLVVGIACAGAAFGLAKRKPWPASGDRYPGRESRR